jgi:hypothetical protein
VAVLKLPYSYVRERYFFKREDQSPFVQQASAFEDFVVRCVRHAFANLPPRIGRIFFSKEVALPFLRFRMWRHGYLTSPVHWHEYRDVGRSDLGDCTICSQKLSIEKIPGYLDNTESNEKTGLMCILCPW